MFMPDGTTIIVILFLLCSLLPFFATVINILNIFREKVILEKTGYWITYIYTGLFFLLIEGEKEYNIAEEYEDTLLNGLALPLHTPISEKYVSALIILLLLYIISHIVISHLKKKLPPLVMAICSVMMVIGILISIGILLQLSKNRWNISEGVFYYIIIFINNILISIPVVEKIILYSEEIITEDDIKLKGKIVQFVYLLVSKSMGWYFFIFITAIPVLLILSVILILFGHSPDAVIKAFTNTSDWKLSQQISPEPIIPPEQNGHYLCTVAANGHEKIVKPTRVGIRHNSKIVVNRQLCIANAFEQLIEERVPKIHRVIRKNYDRYGYPLSKHINTKFQADIVYILMKPMEWFFLICLYTFDIKPENRIAMQYTGNTVNSVKSKF